MKYEITYYDRWVDDNGAIREGYRKDYTNREEVVNWYKNNYKKVSVREGCYSYQKPIF